MFQPFCFGIPPPGRGVKTLPRSKSQKRVSGRVSEGPGRPPPKKTSQKQVSWRLGDSASQNHLFFDSGDSFLTRLGGGSWPGPSETPLETLPETFFDFLRRESIPEKPSPLPHMKGVWAGRERFCPHTCARWHEITAEINGLNIIFRHSKAISCTQTLPARRLFSRK